jgi:hypothetical protein
MNELVPSARLLAIVIGPLQQANDGNTLELAAAQANFEIRKHGWCQCAQPKKDAYYRDNVSGAHGWMCSACRKTTQTG